MTSPADADGFPSVTRDDWEAAVTADLGPDALARRLRFATEDGVVLDALQTEPGMGAGVGEAVARLVALARGANRCPFDWCVRQRVDAAVVSPADVKEVLAGGADSVEFDLGRLDPASVPAKLSVLAAPVGEARAEVALDGLPVSAWDEVLPGLSARGVPVSAGIDPMAAWIAAGARKGPTRDLDAIARLAPHVRDTADHRLLRASAEPWFDAGATAGWSLALALAAAVEYVRTLAGAGVARDVAARQVELELAIGADFFEGIAATRAARLVWARLLEATAFDATAPLHLAVTVGRRVLSRRDPWTNVLRETSVAFAAAVGGADVVRLPPFDERSGATPAAHRLARTTPLVLREEAGLARVADPAGGSWYLDAATGGLAERVWQMLGDIDEAGGLVEALASGMVERRIDAQRAARDVAVRRRTRPITGVSEYPERTVRHPGIARQFTPPPSRFDAPADAEPFERLQDAADSFASARSGRARILLVRLGTPAESSARAAFARGVVEVGGFEAVTFPEVTSAEQVANGWRTSGAAAAVLCGTDARYATDAATMAAALKQAGASFVLLAGRPGADADALRAAGVDDFVFLGADVVAVLERLLRSAGVLA